MTNKIRIGPAGWSYKDWEGIVYPHKPGAKFDPLEYLARFFDAIEINSSFYRPFTAGTAKSWARRVTAAKEFLFTAKLHRVFTHERGKATEADEKAVREGKEVGILQDAEVQNLIEALKRMDRELAHIQALEEQEMERHVGAS